MSDSLTQLRSKIDHAMYADEMATIQNLAQDAALDDVARHRIHLAATELVENIRSAADPGLMEVFLAEYGLSTDEGIALMCLAEALLRVPDAETMDELIEDKIAPSDWGKHLGHSASSLVNASTWALMLTGRVLDDEKTGISGALRGAVKRLGEPVIRTAVARAMREMGRQFVLGEDIARAMKRAEGMQAKGFTYSYDMLGEAARTEADARGYHLAYSEAISAIAKHCSHGSVAENPGISIKLSALHPRYEVSQRETVMRELVPRARALAVLAKSAGMGFNIDAEEADRLSLSLDVITAILSEPALAGWDGFGVVVQAYGQRAGDVIEYLHELSTSLDRKIMVRLVKGAYWDAEIKRAQVEGMPGFPVFTAKAHTDISYLANARKLLQFSDRLYPQFATHNAHTVAAVLDMARTMKKPAGAFEFQRLHGMGEVMHTQVLQAQGTRCRIYAPVGAHEDLLAYLVRRLLENGANSSFVNQIVDEDVPATEVASDPFLAIGQLPPLASAQDLFAPQRVNSKGWDLTHAPTLAALDAARDVFATYQWQSAPILAQESGSTVPILVVNPADGSSVGSVHPATATDVDVALAGAQNWSTHVSKRANILNAVADAYENAHGEIFALLAREAGKCLPDAVAELREAVDFLRYYAAQARDIDAAPRGTWVCISPWNFPLAIFTGQIAAALSTGNAVIAKPAEQTPLIAALAVRLMHQAGVPRAALQLLPGDGAVGAAATSDARIAGVAFTGSTGTAKKIALNMANHCAPGTPLIAETGGLNAMIVDSTALPEHAVRDIVNGAFRSAGQRCSALRCLYVQDDIADGLLQMLSGAMHALVVDDPWQLSTDVGPIIDANAKDVIEHHVAKAKIEGRVLYQINAPKTGTFVGPVAIAVDGIEQMEREIFGPVLHVARFEAAELDDVIAQVNATGFGLTFGLHTRIDDRVEQIVTQVEAGNIYVNRDQIGAVVGSQPFGGEGLSGTGPKAGGPNYLHRFVQTGAPSGGTWATDMPLTGLEDALHAADVAISPRVIDLPGPTGESNRLHIASRPPVLCLGPGKETATAQAELVKALGGIAVQAEGQVAPKALALLKGYSAVIWWGAPKTGRDYAKVLATRDGPIVPLITSQPDPAHVLTERHVCIDTTAAGGNAALLASVGG